MTEKAAEVSVDFGQQVTSQPAQATDWRADLPKELRGKYREFKSPADFVKGYDGLVRKLGQKPITVPSDDAPEEQKSAYREAVLDHYKRVAGVPDTIDDYKISAVDKAPEGIRDLISSDELESYKKLGHELGIPPSAMDKLVAKYLDNVGCTVQQLQAQAKEAYDSAINHLKREWGPDYESNVQAAISVAKKHFPELAEKGNPVEQRYGNDPYIIKMLADFARKTGEDNSIATQSPVASDSADSIRERARELTKKAFDGSVSPQEREEANLKATELYKQLVSLQRRS